MNWRVPLANIDFGLEEAAAVLDVWRSRWLQYGKCHAAGFAGNTLMSPTQDVSPRSTRHRPDGSVPGSAGERIFELRVLGSLRLETLLSDKLPGVVY